MSEENHYPLKLGVTGGIGSGKTSVCRVFTVLGIPVFSADPVAGEIMENNQEVRQKINNIAGKDLYPQDRLDRSGLAGIIFNDKTVLDKINSLIHPLVFENFKNWTNRQESPYVIMEAAILFESGAAKLVDRVATVVAPEEERIRRVMLRNNLSREMVMQRIRNQMNDEEKIRRSDYVISNSENDMILPAILKIHEDIIKNIHK